MEWDVFSNVTLPFSCEIVRSAWLNELIGPGNVTRVVIFEHLHLLSIPSDCVHLSLR